MASTQSRCDHRLVCNLATAALWAAKTLRFMESPLCPRGVSLGQRPEMIPVCNDVLSLTADRADRWFLVASENSWTLPFLDQAKMEWQLTPQSEQVKAVLAKGELSDSHAPCFEQSTSAGWKTLRRNGVALDSWPMYRCNAGAYRADPYGRTPPPRQPLARPRRRTPLPNSHRVRDPFPYHQPSPDLPPNWFKLIPTEVRMCDLR